MLARLILALLLAAFAFPAAAPAACHDAGARTMALSPAMPHAMPMPAADHQKQKAVPSHGCIGCVPPSNWSAPPVAGVVPLSGPLLIERAHMLAIGAVPGPDTPPPRIA